MSDLVENPKDRFSHEAAQFGTDKQRERERIQNIMIDDRSNRFYSRPAKSPDLGRRLPAFSLHCRLSGFDVYFTGEIEKSAGIFFSDRVFYDIRQSDFNKGLSLLNINRQRGVTSPQVSNRLNRLRHNTLNLIIGLLKGSIKLKEA